MPRILPLPKVNAQPEQDPARTRFLMLPPERFPLARPTHACWRAAFRHTDDSEVSTFVRYKYYLRQLFHKYLRVLS